MVVTVMNGDPAANVDTIIIPITQPKSPSTFTGKCRKASIEVSVQITEVPTLGAATHTSGGSSAAFAGSVAFYVVAGIFAGLPMLA